MGKYRAQDLKREIKWAKEKGWCISLGVPIGNELDESKWWSEKINSVRKKTGSSSNTTSISDVTS
eukprot:852143-Prymnesium_polylepis.1